MSASSRYIQYVFTVWLQTFLMCLKRSTASGVKGGHSNSNKYLNQRLRFVYRDPARCSLILSSYPSNKSTHFINSGRSSNTHLNPLVRKDSSYFLSSAYPIRDRLIIGNSVCEYLSSFLYALIIASVKRLITPRTSGLG